MALVPLHNLIRRLVMGLNMLPVRCSDVRIMLIRADICLSLTCAMMARRDFLLIIVGELSLLFRPVGV